MTDVALHLGDALGPNGLATLAAGSVDVAILDPPWDERTHRSRITVDGNVRTVGGCIGFAPFGDAEIERTAAELGRLVRRWSLVFVAERQLGAWVAALERAGVELVRMGAAVRANPAPAFTGDRPAVGIDHVIIGHRAGVRKRWEGGGRPAVWRAPPARYDEGGQVHPTQKPLSLMRALVEDFSDRGELVLDPFAGSGTTGLACRLAGRRFVGWEIDVGYSAAAERRIAGAREQLALISG